MKITRDAFLYMEPDGSEPEFAQCGTCMMRVPQTSGEFRCSIHGPDVEITSEMSCGLFVAGESMPKDHETMPLVTPDESGLVDREVRCENCAYYEEDEQECELFEMLNEKFPDQFDLDERVAPEGCCNAQVPDATLPTDEPEDTGEERAETAKGFSRVTRRG